MTAKTSTGTGTWSTDSLWNPAGVPANGDSVIIAAGHVVTFDVDQSSWADGLVGLQITGTLRVKTDANTCLKMAAHITGNGYLYIGNSDGDRIGASYTAKLYFNGGYAVMCTYFYVYGAVKNHKGQLAQNANSGTATLVFTTDVGLAANDRIFIMTRTAGRNAEDKVVQSYDPGTKTAILTTNLASNHFTDDWVAIVTRNVLFDYIAAGKTQHTQGTYTRLEYCELRHSDYGFTNNHGMYAKGISVTDCNRDGLWGRVNWTLESCVFTTADSAFGRNNTLKATDCVIAQCYCLLYYNVSAHLKDCVIFNINDYGDMGSWLGCFQNCQFLYMGAGGVFQWLQFPEITDCYFKGSANNFYYVIGGLVRNTLFVDGTLIAGNVDTYKQESHVLQFHDYNQTPGDHRAYMLGGWAKSESSVVHWGPKSLKFEPASATWRVWSPLLRVPFKNGVQRSVTFYVRKSASMAWLPRVYLIRPGQSPLMFSSLSPLATFTMPNDNNDTWEVVTGTYTHTSDEVLELIAVAKNGSGYVYFADPVVM